jgi:cytochrome c oxidase assembly protein subunit 15
METTAAAPPGFVARSSADWRRSIPEPRRRHLRAWLWSVAALTLGVLIVGGITRLTESGLSIVDWQPLLGVIPPLDDAQWQATFDRYRQFPQYQQLRPDMTLAEFRFIFFWEWFHRLLARTIGIVFLVPFAFFAVRGYFNRPLALRALALFALGGLQGLMGWLMVASGLVDRPSVSHFRLAAHLSLAFIIFGYAVWLIRDLSAGAARATVGAATRRTLGRGVALVGALLGAQIVWGAFVAGLDAGFIFNSFPLMGGRWIPATLLQLEPAVGNFVQNPAAVQWVHRVLGTVLVLAALSVFLHVGRAGADAASRRMAGAILVLLALQYLLGVLTLLWHVPVPIAVTHQAAAMIIFGAWTAWAHYVRSLYVA